MAHPSQALASPVRPSSYDPGTCRERPARRQLALPPFPSRGRSGHPFPFRGATLPHNRKRPPACARPTSPSHSDPFMNAPETAPARRPTVSGCTHPCRMFAPQHNYSILQDLSRRTNLPRYLSQVFARAPPKNSRVIPHSLSPCEHAVTCPACFCS